MSIPSRRRLRNDVWPAPKSSIAIFRPERLHRREQTLDLVDRFERQRLDDLDDQPRSRAGCAPSTDFEPIEPARRAQGRDREIDRNAQARFGDEAVERELEHALIELVDEPRLLGDREIGRRADDFAVLLPDPQQSLVERDAPVGGGDHRLVGDEDAALIERGEDLVGDRRLAATARR